MVCYFNTKAMNLLKEIDLPCEILVFFDVLYHRLLFSLKHKTSQLCNLFIVDSSYLLTNCKPLITDQLITDQHLLTVTITYQRFVDQYLITYQPFVNSYLITYQPFVNHYLITYQSFVNH